MSAEQRSQLRKVSLFRELSDEDCDAVLAAMRPRRFAVDDIVFEQGDVGDTMLVVVEGRLRVELSDGSGNTTDVGSIGADQFVGEMAAFDPAPRSATVIAATETLGFELSVHALRELRRNSPTAAAAITSGVISDITLRLRSINDRIERELNPNAARARSQARASGIVQREQVNPQFRKTGEAPQSGVHAATGARSDDKKLDEKTGVAKWLSRLFGG
ncbi:MAG: cyclic nucleotide-binding domain-containing protein [Deltaproteobacteria bacterium]|nr:cyclic nucleotide-binding domain-containing protein [Deltaproteobacteria bacterium]